MYFELEEYAKRISTEYVATLCGRYREYVSDAFIITFLTKNYMDAVYENKNGDKQNAAYKAACPLFERYLEYGCKAGGNGHHVAQAFASRFPYDEKVLENIPGLKITKDE